MDDQNNKGELGKLYSMHRRDEKCIQWFSKKPVGERHDNEPLSSIQGGELLEYINDSIWSTLSGVIYLFVCLFM